MQLPRKEMIRFSKERKAGSSTLGCDGQDRDRFKSCVAHTIGSLTHRTGGLT
jgi:hypothetical protein